MFLPRFNNAAKGLRIFKTRICQTLPLVRRVCRLQWVGIPICSFSVTSFHGAQSAASSLTMCSDHSLEREIPEFSRCSSLWKRIWRGTCFKSNSPGILKYCLMDKILRLSLVDMTKTTCHQQLYHIINSKWFRSVFQYGLSTMVQKAQRRIAFAWTWPSHGKPLLQNAGRWLRKKGPSCGRPAIFAISAPPISWSTGFFLTSWGTLLCWDWKPLNFSPWLGWCGSWRFRWPRGATMDCLGYDRIDAAVPGTLHPFDWP